LAGITFVPLSPPKLKVMLKNYFKIAIRQLSKQKMYAVIKIGGFALSIAACLLIALYIRYELSYDRFYPDADRIHRLVGERTDNGVTQPKGLAWPAPFAKALRDEFPEVEMTARIMPSRLFTGAGANQLRRADKVENTYEEGFTFADPELLELFNIPLVYGDRAHALDGPNTIVISKRKADKYFPHENPVGKVLILNDDLSKPYRIGGVMKDFPANTHLQYDFLLSLKGIELWPGEQSTWMASNYETYARLRPGTDIEKFNKKVLDVILNKYYIPVLKQAGASIVKEIGKSIKLRILAQPLTDVHLRSYDTDEDRPHGDIRFIWLFGSIAVFILIIACINFVNLSTARSANRAREVGLKKAIGSYRSDLIKQFLTESLLYSFLSFAIGIVIAWLLLPYFNALSGKPLSIPWTAWWLAPLFTTAAFVIGIVAGIYPAFYLSSFQPIAVLKGQLSKGAKNSNLRSTLVVFQFTTSIILIIGTFIINRQMQFILHKELGFEKDQVLMIEGANTLGKQVSTFKQELLHLQQVQQVSVSDFLPVDGTKRNGNGFSREGKESEEAEVPGQFWTVDHDYIQTMGMRMVAGRNFSKDMPTDSQATIINQAMAAKLFPGEKDVIGKRISNNNSVYEVIGVVQDFNFETMRNSIKPVSMALGNSPTIVSVKLKTADMQKTIAAITGVWKSIVPHQPFRYTFLDQRFTAMYDDVRRTGTIFTSFAVLAIIVACLGLFALSAYMAEQRSKEISIRKVLGASVAQVTALISKDFVKLVVISVLLASPIAWWGMNKWLQDFAYQTTISWWIFAAAGVLVVIIALITISFQSIRAAVANPVDSLRGE
jgi:putative ABC transport system permease protein